MRVKFITDKGYAKAGTIEDYPDIEAQTLIKEGVAVEVVPEPEKSDVDNRIFKKIGKKND